MNLNRKFSSSLLLTSGLLLGNLAQGESYCSDNGGNGWDFTAAVAWGQTIDIPVDLGADKISNARVFVDVTHDWVGDVVLDLRSPAGTQVRLYERPGTFLSTWGCSRNNFRISFDDNASLGPLNPSYDDGCPVSGSNVSPAYDGPYKPVDDLSVFSTNNEDASGIWQLTITDAANIESTNRLNEFCVTIDVPRPDLSYSNLSVVDINGGNVNRGDILEFRATIRNDGNREGIASLSGDIASHLTNFQVLSTPNNSVDQSDLIAGSNGNGFLEIENIEIPINGSGLVVFRAEVNNLAPDGTSIQQALRLVDQFSEQLDLSAYELTVSDPVAPPASGNKPLYFVSNTELSRNLNDVSNNVYRINVRESQNWSLRELTTADISVNSGNIPLTLVACVGNNSCNQQGNAITVDVSVFVNDGFGDTELGTTSFTLNPSNSPQTINLSVPNNLGSFILQESSTVTVKISHLGGNNRGLRIFSNRNNQTSQLDLSVATLIKVENLEFWDSNYFSGGSRKNYFQHNENVFFRSLVSDPFGAFDITNAQITITDPNNNVVVNSNNMSVVFSDSIQGEKTFEFSYNLGSSPTIGSWKVQVTAIEGFESSPITDSITNYFYVGNDTNLSVVKTVDNVSPNLGESVEYLIRLQNLGPADATNIGIIDLLPNELTFNSVTLLPNQSYNEQDGNWFIPSLGAGQSTNIYIRATPTDSGVITNTATVNFLAQVDTNSSDNTSSVDINVVGPAELSVSRSVSPTTAEPGTFVTHSIQITNIGGVPADNISVKEEVTLFLSLELDPNSTGILNGSESVSCISGCAAGVLELNTIVFSSDPAGTVFDYVPTNSGDGTDGNIAFWRSLMSGQLNAGDSFELQYRAKIK